MRLRKEDEKMLTLAGLLLLRRYQKRLKFRKLVTRDKLEHLIKKLSKTVKF